MECNVHLYNMNKGISNKFTKSIKNLKCIRFYIYYRLLHFH